MQQVNLYQLQFRRQKQKFSATTMFHASAVVLTGIILLTGLNLWQIQRLEGHVQDIDRQSTDLTERFKTLTETLATRKKDEALALEVTRMERLIQGRYRVQEVLQKGVLSNTKGFSQYFTAFARQRINGLWLTTFDISGPAESMTLRGRSTQAELVPRYIQKLSAEDILSGTEFRVFHVERPQKKGKKTAARYMDFVISTEADIQDQESSRAERLVGKAHQLRGVVIRP